MTFGLNFWKGERGVRRANLERLYTAVHRTIGGVGALKPHSPMGLVEILRNIQPVSHQTMMGNIDRHSCL
jgi:hypothetical protein